MQIVSEVKTQTGLGTVNMVCHRSFEEAALIKDRWDEFAERIGADIYSSFDWCQIWWKHFGKGRQLEIYIASVDGKIVAILPMFREKIHWGPFSLRVVRLVGCDHLSTLCNFAIDADWTSAVAGALVSQLNRGQVWDVIHFGELTGYCKSADAFAGALQNYDGNGTVIFGDNDYPHMIFEIPDSFEEYFKKLSRNERHNIKRNENGFLKKGKLSWRLPKSREEFEQAMDRLIEFHTKQWNQRGRLGHFSDWPGVDAFHREIGRRLLESGRLLLVEVYQNDEFVASEYGGRFGSRAHWIIGARGADTSGKMGFCSFVRNAIDEGVRQIDALAGYYDYKRRLGAKVLGVKNITVVHNRLSSQLRFRIMRAISRCIELVYWRIWFWHLALDSAEMADPEDWMAQKGQVGQVHSFAFSAGKQKSLSCPPGELTCSNEFKGNAEIFMFLVIYARYSDN